MNDYNQSINYPFKSKYKFIKDTNIKTDPYIPDYQLKPVKKLSKPDFSYEPNCWEMDIMFTKNIEEDEDEYDEDEYIDYQYAYLVLINVNTKYLIVKPLLSKKARNFTPLFHNIAKDFQINTLKCDDEKAFTSDIFRDYCNQEPIYISTKNGIRYKKESDIKYKRSEFKYAFTAPNKIKLIINDSPFVNAHKVVDAVIRTIRNAFGLSDKRISNNILMQQMVEWYNNTPHSSLRLLNPYYDEIDDEVDKYLSKKEPKYIYLTPDQMQNDKDLEWKYIRARMMELRETQQKQLTKGLLSYNPGNIIIIHTDYGKTKKKHEKRRRVFNELAEFISYESGNVKCRLLNPSRKIIKSNKNRSIITVPIIYTKYASSSIDTLNDDYKRFFLIEKNES